MGRDLEIKQTTIHLIKPIDPFKEFKKKRAKNKTAVGFPYFDLFLPSPNKNKPNGSLSRAVAHEAECKHDTELIKKTGD